MSDFLGKRLPRELDAYLSRIQGAVLATARPLASAWKHLIEGGLAEDLAMVVPGKEVFALVQQTLCLVGNTSELITGTRRSKILEAIDGSWSKFGNDKFPSAKDTIFGGEFQSTLTSKVEKDTALSKAVSITKKSRREEEATSSERRRGRPARFQFFRGSPPAIYGGRQGKNFVSYNPHRRQFKDSEHSQGQYCPTY